MDHFDPARRPFRASIAPLTIALVILLALAGCSSEDSGAVDAAASGSTVVPGVEAATAAGEVAVVDPSMDRPVNPSTAAVRLIIANGSDEADSLVGASSPDGDASIHRSDIDDEGRSVMRSVDSIELPARSSVVFESGGLHVMLTGITRDLEVGDTVSITFDFAHSDPVVVEVPVVEPLSSLDEAHDDHDQHDQGATAPEPTTATAGALR